MKRYNPKEIEPKWQKIWDETGVYTANLASDKPKYVAMSMFNYPSGAGIHIGHAMNYTISDVKARFKRQQGYESYHPVGWDSFGLPAENYAIKAGISPQESMATIIPGYHKQYKAMGWSNDWEKEIATHLPEYYKWTQWIFAQMYKKGLAYQDARLQWWCEKCQTVLANEQVIDGKCWRHDGPDDSLVQKKEVKQWFFKITDYADELLEATDALDWTESVKLAQKNWIGRSVGAEIEFKVEGGQENITVFTTRADTIFSAAFIVLAPEHDLVRKVTTPDKKQEVEDYAKASIIKSDLERQAVGDKEKTGVFTGAYALNPANDEKIPIWIADFVLAGYGTGAVFGDIHDERDFEFIKKFNIPARTTVVPEYIDPEPFKKDVKTVERVAVQCIVKHPNEDTYLLLERTAWADGSHSFVTGGVEDGETIEEAAKREMIEETGYKSITSVTPLTAPFYAQFYHKAKDVNRRVFMHSVVVELSDLDQQAVSAEEEALHQLRWLNFEEARAKVIGEGCKRALDEYKYGAVAYTGEGILIDSGEFSGMRTEAARGEIIKWLAAKRAASEKVNYKMRDWSVSRQRYWGAPIPIIDCPACGPVLVPDEELPVILPELDDFQPSGDGRSALARAKDWLVVECPKCDGPGERETDTLDTYICSSWYMYRYFDPRNQQVIFDSETANKWAPVDFYNGGDHATAHLLYARFMARFFNKIGLINNPEPFKQMLFNGKVTAADGTMFSKSKGTGIDPLEIINSGYGADALRTYLMFAAPLQLSTRWDAQGVPGAHRFLSRLWNLTQEYLEADEASPTDEQQADILRAVHKMTKKVTEDVEENRYNTAIAAIMTCLNELYKLKAQALSRHPVWKEALERMTACTAPFAPHMADELWHELGYSTSVHHDSWPAFDEKYLASDEITIVVQVNGKLRANIQVAADADKDTVIAVAQADDKVRAYIEGGIKKTIYVPGKLVNFVI